jgi:hypothetical protein
LQPFVHNKEPQTHTHTGRELQMLQFSHNLGAFMRQQ